MGRSFSPRHITVTITFTLLLFFFSTVHLAYPLLLLKLPLFIISHLSGARTSRTVIIFSLFFLPHPPHAPMPTIQHLLFLILLPFYFSSPFVSFAFAINISPRNDVLMEHNTPLIRSLPLLLKNTFFSTMV